MTPYDKLMFLKDTLEKLSSDPLKEGIDIKLNRVAENYNRAIELNCSYILSRSNYKVFKALNRYETRREKDNESKDVRGFIEII